MEHQEDLEKSLLRQELEATRWQLEQMLHSRSWRLTAPLRAAGTALRTAARHNVLARKLLNLYRRYRDSRILQSAPGGGTASRPSLSSLKEQFSADALHRLETFLESDVLLRLPQAHSNPKVSIILVLYNQAHLTFLCLQSLAQISSISLETIIVDNGSTDQTSRLLSQVEGITLLDNDENLGFLKAVNQAAKVAHGEHILLLNNDAVLLPGALEAAVARLDLEPAAGAVGGKLILPDGTLQEAGSIVWQDGSCLGYGRGDAPDAAPYQYVREVDYCSGAFLLIRTELFRQLGGFDEIYAPAYYEESDFCLRLRQAGFSILYDPGIEVLHYEFGSSASKDKAIALQTKNRATFVERHKEWLAANHVLPAMELVNQSRDRRPVAGRILMVDDRLPFPSLGSGFPRAFEMLQYLHSCGYFISHYPLQFPNDRWHQIRTTFPDTMEALVDYGRTRFLEFLEERQGYYDILLISRPHNMRLISELLTLKPSLTAGMKIVYDAEAIFALRTIQEHKVFGTPLPPREAQKMIDEELLQIRYADHVLTVSANEAALFAGAGCRNVHVVGHQLVADPTPAAYAERSGILFVGALNEDRSPNVDSLVWFVNEVLPQLNMLTPEPLPVRIAGSSHSAKIRNLTSSQVSLLGRVDDLRPCYNQARLFIVPTRFAAGIPHKAHEAAAAGLPMVVTPLIAQQLGWAHRKDVMIGESPASFAQQIYDLYYTPELWEHVRANALQKVLVDCSADSFRKGIQAALGGKL